MMGDRAKHRAERTTSIVTEAAEPLTGADDPDTAARDDQDRTVPAMPKDNVIRADKRLMRK